MSYNHIICMLSDHLLGISHFAMRIVGFFEQYQRRFTIKCPYRVSWVNSVENVIKNTAVCLNIRRLSIYSFENHSIVLCCSISPTYDINLSSIQNYGNIG